MSLLRCSNSCSFFPGQRRTAELDAVDGMRTKMFDDVVNRELVCFKRGEASAQCLRTNRTPASRRDFRSVLPQLGSLVLFKNICDLVCTAGVSSAAICQNRNCRCATPRSSPPPCRFVLPLSLCLRSARFLSVPSYGISSGLNNGLAISICGESVLCNTSVKMIGTFSAERCMLSVGEWGCNALAL